jgi:hypothetical protein
MDGHGECYHEEKRPAISERCNSHTRKSQLQFSCTGSEDVRLDRRQTTSPCPYPMTDIHLATLNGPDAHR